MAHRSTLGNASLKCPSPLIAGKTTTAIIRYRVGRAGVKVGGKIRFGIPNSGWGEPHVPFPRYWDEVLSGKDRMFVPYKRVNTTATVRTKGKANLFLYCQERMMAPESDATIGYWRWWITALVEEDALRKGDVIELTYGDRNHGEDGVRIQRYPEKDISFLVYVDARGNGDFVEVPGSPMLRNVTAGRSARFNVVAPSVVRPGQAFEVRASATDKCHCRPRPRFSGRVRGRIGDRKVRDLKRLRLGRAGHIRVTVSDKTGTITGVSNPIACSKTKPSLYWGDLHGQSENHVFNAQAQPYLGRGRKGISIGTYDECYTYARDVALLDFLAITDQGVPLSGAWQQCQEKARQYHDPGKFVTFKAFEAGTDVGHRNVIYSTDDIEPRFDPKRFSQMPDRLYEYFRDRDDVIMIPHHTKVWTDWSYHDPDLELLTEVYSCWGCSERPGLDHWDKGMTPGASMQEGLRRGYRLGIIASSDNHAGMPGRSFPGGDRQFATNQKGGLAAVYAPELTREAIFASLRNRWCYGTTGARIVLDFHINGARMGEEIVLDDPRQERDIKAHIIGTDRIKTVDIVKNNDDWLTIHGTSDVVKLKETDSSSVRGTDFYYVRVRQEDGEMAWSSPIWVTAKSKKRSSRKRK
ncbi:MAG: DUF3604 domain-containing protein [Planctomycetes bacterium]|nr:DUF3604 domain-containing protein [Planctomycetota bacterium]